MARRASPFAYACAAAVVVTLCQCGADFTTGSDQGDGSSAVDATAENPAVGHDATSDDGLGKETSDDSAGDGTIHDDGNADTSAHDTSTLDAITVDAITLDTSAADGGSDALDATIDNWDGWDGFDGFDGFYCDSGLVCSGQCVDPQSTDHCGSCNNVCSGPDSGNGQATCTLPGDGGVGTCGIDCNSGYHVCNGQCLSDADVPHDDPCVITETWGVFVSPSGNDGNTGTRQSPLKTIGHAFDVAKGAGKRVYACGGTYDEKLVIGSTRDGVKAYGGLDCSNWTYNANDLAIVAPGTQGYALELDGLSTGVTFEDFEFDAQATLLVTDSSVAIFAKLSPATLRRVSASAGNVNGLAVTAGTFSNYSGNAPNGQPGTGSGGGAGGSQTCLDTTTSSAGGSGGFGGSGPGGDGHDGSSVPAVGGSNKGFVGCNPGTTGANGLATAGGQGATSSGKLASTGWTTTDGANGKNGNPGQGGGGGGGTGGPSSGGGGGGGGGCGGGGGYGGKTGGSSIVVLAYQSALTIEKLTFVAHGAGIGGGGGPGQTNQAFGTSGSGFGVACAGGPGGCGAGGSGGGGGAGGLSAGIVWSGTAPTIDGTVVQSANTLNGVTLATAGAQGNKGSGGGTATCGSGVAGMDGTAGAAGTAVAVMQSQ